MTTPVPTRRERARAETVEQILDAARGQLREVGAAQLSLRAVAGAVGMSPAGLYRYYDSREALLTALIADGFDALAAAVERARSEAAGDITERMLAAALAFRAWGLAHPQEFGLLYGDPIPGYAAPPDGPTSAASRRVGAALMPPLLEAWRAGRLRVPAGPALDDDPAARRWAVAIHPDLPVDAAGVLLGAWTRLHGLVVLEVFGHLRWLGPDTGVLARAQLRALVDDVITAPPR